MSNKWTQAQLNAINALTGDVLVSASAGSGKTAVMIERLVRLIESGVDVDNVLCLTFTKAAAAEMKERLHKALVDRLKDESRESEKIRLSDQLDRLPFASITTIDSFCNTLVKRYFSVLDAPTNLDIATNQECMTRKITAGLKVLEQNGEKAEEVYLTLVEFLGKKRSEGSILDILIDIDGHLSSLPDPEEYLEFAKRGYEVDYLQNPVIDYALRGLRYDLREIESIATKDLEFGLPFPEEVRNFVLRAQDCLKKQEISKIWEIEIPKNPNYNQKIYKETKEYSYKRINYLKTKFHAFLDKYQNFDLEKAKRDIRELQPYVHKLIELIQEFRGEYARLMRADNLTDFAEIERMALTCLRDDKVLQEVRERYRHVLVDEYQDTNRLQEEILNRAGGESSSFRVGDAKQSIYSFRHTEPEIFLEKQDDERVQNFVLKDNFRQNWGIIDFVNGVFGEIMTKNWTGSDYNAEAMGKGLSLEKAQELEVEICEIVDEEQEEEVEEGELDLYSVRRGTEEAKENKKNDPEGEYLYREIKNLVGKREIYDAKAKKNRKIGYEDIVVLYRGGESIKPIIEYLREREIPIGLTTSENNPYSVQYLMHLLKILENPEQEDSLVIVMLSPLFEFEEKELQNYVIAGRKKQRLYQTIKNLGATQPKLRDFFTKLDDYRFRAKYVDVYSLLEYIIQDLDYDTKIAKMVGGENESRKLTSFLDSLAGSKKGQSLTTFLRGLDKNPENETKIETGGGNCVRFMTMHGSKGLEFPVVFLIKTGKKTNNQDATVPVVFHKKLGVAMDSFIEDEQVRYENFMMRVIKERIKDENLVQEMRLLYVAMTRARNLLYICGKPTQKSGEKIDEKEAGCLLDFIKVALNKNSTLNSLVKQRSFGGEREEKRGEREEEKQISSELVSLYRARAEYIYPYQKSIKTPTKYTVTQLTKDEYEGEEGIATPISQAESADVGTLYHKIMQRIDFEAKTVGAVEKELDKMVIDEWLSEEERKGVDESIIAKVLSHQVFDRARGHKCRREAGFLLRAKAKDITKYDCEDEVLLQGVIDLLIEGEEYIVVDYKYSGARVDVLKTRYQKQLELYQKAVKDIYGTDKVKVYLFSLKTAECVEIE